MNVFDVGTEFTDMASVFEAKKKYEEASKTLLSISACHKLKTSDDISKKCVYDRLEFSCKAGRERKSKSKGLRQSSTYKMGCPVKVNISFNGAKLVVKNAGLNHENHLMNQQVYDHYPENMRLKEDELVIAEKMVKVGGNKKKIKSFLQNERGKPIPIKALHNLQTKINSAIEGASNENVLEKLFQALTTVPGSRVRFISNEDDDELIGIFYQDARMAQLYDSYPEVVLYDATYKLNNHQLPLFIQCVIDGNGETEIASLYICKSESREGIGAMIDVFKEFNPNWHQTRVFIGDKDFADRSIYTEKFPDAVLQICLYHVLLIFHREITTAKRKITVDERLQALEVLQRIVYSQSSAAYNGIYQELCDLNLEHVTAYFNTFWHPIRDEWTLYGRNKYAYFLNTTNNRSERLNRTLKEIGNRYSNLLIFFQNLSTSVAVLSSEKDIKAVRTTMRLIRKRFDEPALQQYNQLLTPFVFKKVEEQLELCNTVRIDLRRITEETFETQSGHVVSDESCSCTFFSSMKVPCRHIFKLLQSEERDLFVPSLCLERWTKQYYNASHPALSNNEQITLPRPIHLQRIRVPDEISKYRKTATITKDINNLAASMSSSQYDFYIGKIQALRREMNNPNESVPEEESNQAQSMPNVNVDGSAAPSTQPNPIANQTPQNVQREMSNRNEAPSMPNVNVDGSAAPSTPPNPIASQTPQNDQREIPNRNEAASMPNVNVDGFTAPSTQPNPIPNRPPQNDQRVMSNWNRAASMSNMNVDQSAGSSTLPNHIDFIANMVGSPTFAHDLMNRIVSMVDANYRSDSTCPTPQASSMPNQTFSTDQTFSDSAMPYSSAFLQPSPTEADGVCSTPSSMTSNHFQRSDIKSIKLPSKVVPHGRPKGSGLTVIGTKKKEIDPKKRKSNETVTVVPAKIKFLELSAPDQSLKLVQWLTNKTATDILRKKISIGDLIQDSNAFNRLRNDAVDLNGIKKLVDTKCFSYLKSEVDRLQDLMWGCSKCKRNLTGEQIMCNGCLDWYHLTCVSDQKGKIVDPFYCNDCK